VEGWKDGWLDGWKSGRLDGGKDGWLFTAGYDVSQAANRYPIGLSCGYLGHQFNPFVPYQPMSVNQTGLNILRF